VSDSAKKREHWVGFDLGGTKMLAAVFDPKFEIVGRRRKKTRGHEGQKVGLERIASSIRDALEEAKVDVDDVGGIGIGCPGPIRMDDGVIAEAPNLGWHDVPVREVLEKEFGRPVIHESVELRSNDIHNETGAGYQPWILGHDHDIEPWTHLEDWMKDPAFTEVKGNLQALESWCEPKRPAGTR